MNTFALLLGLASAAELPAQQYRIDMVVYQGDPLGSKAAGNLDILSRPILQVCLGQTGTVQVGQDFAFPATVVGEVPNTRPVGVAVRVTPRPAPGGAVLLRMELQHTTVAPGPGVRTGDGLSQPAFNVETVETAVRVKPGETERVRMSARSATDQTWVELTVRPAK
ncbi:MAG: type II and III secretion system protein [Gemmataceae bacterium]|nr:type II and III secretion system protein [Gemmataceae bacterium]